MKCILCIHNGDVQAKHHPDDDLEEREERRKLKENDRKTTVV